MFLDEKVCTVPSILSMYLLRKNTKDISIETFEFKRSIAKTTSGRTLNKNRSFKSRAIFVLCLLTFSIILTSMWPQTHQTEPEIRGVLLLNTLDDLKPDYTEQLKELCEKYETPLKVINNEEVNVKLFKNLRGEYSLVLVRLHSATARNQTWLFTGEKYSEEKYTLDQIYHNVIRARPAYNEDYYFCITSSFMEISLKTDLVFLMGCYGISTEDLSRTFIQAGANSVVGWNGAVDLNFSDKVSLELCELVLGGANQEEIYQFCMFHDPDPIYHTQVICNQE